MSLSRRSLLFLAVILTPILLVSALLIGGQSAAVEASSHREAPLISKDQFADTTDTYVFIPQGSTDRIVLLANWIPGEFPEGGPNYYEWDDTALYDIHVDIDGNATSDVTYTLSSRVEVGNSETFLYNVGPIDNLADTDWNRRQYITVTEYFDPAFLPDGANAPAAPDDHITQLVDNQLTSPVNIGSKSTPNYMALMDEATRTYNDPGGPGAGDVINVFGGQADDSFWVDLQIFDLLTLREQPEPIGYSVGNNDAIDSLSGFNVHTLAVEVPIDRLVRDAQPVLGVWATTRRGSTAVLNAPEGDVTEYVQVSRLGSPLVNEVVIPLSLKDAFNTIPPSVDATLYGALDESIEDPEVGNLLCGLYGVPLPNDTDDDCVTEYTEATPASGRPDLVEIFLTGIIIDEPFTINTAGGPFELPAGFNVNSPAGVVPAEMLRINTGISGDLCAPTPSPLGVLGQDACGYPNGRRLIDEVIEISLLAVAGAGFDVIAGNDVDPDFDFNADLIPVLDDNVDGNDQPFTSDFPYVAMAQSGQEHIHENPVSDSTSLSFGAITLSQNSTPWLQVLAALGSVALVGGLELLRRRSR